MRAQSLKEQKQELLAARFQMRSQAEKQKEEMMKAFERMQAKGKIDNKELSKLGVDPGAFNKSGTAGGEKSREHAVQEGNRTMQSHH